jgi:hypothetical protein
VRGCSLRKGGSETLDARCHRWRIAVMLNIKMSGSVECTTFRKNIDLFSAYLEQELFVL